jgi:hypothetical protein
MHNLLIAAAKWLKDLDVKTEECGTLLRVNRGDLAAFITGTPDEQCDEVLKELREAIGTKKLVWGSRTEEWANLECF